MCLEEREKADIYFGEGGHGFECFKRELGHIFGSFICKEFGILLRGKGLQTPVFANEILCKHLLIIYTDFIEKIIVGNTKARLLRCAPLFLS